MIGRLFCYLGWHLMEIYKEYDPVDGPTTLYYSRCKRGCGHENGSP